MEVIGTGGVDLLPRDRVPYFGHAAAADERQVFTIPIKCHVPHEPVDIEGRERICPRTAHVPEVELTALIGRPGEQVAIRAETETGDHPIRRPGNLLQQQLGVRSSVRGAGDNLPEDYPPLTTSGEMTAVGAKSAGPNLWAQRVLWWRQFLPGGRLPEANAAGVVARGQDRAVRAKGDCLQFRAKAVQLVDESTRGGVPNPDRPVFACRRQASAVRTESDTGNPTNVCTHDELLSGGCKVPDRDHSGRRARGCDEELTVLAESDNTGPRTVQDGDLAVRRDLPQPNDPTLRIRKSDHLVVRAEADRRRIPEPRKVEPLELGSHKHSASLRPA